MSLRWGASDNKLTRQLDAKFILQYLFLTFTKALKIHRLLTQNRYTKGNLDELSTGVGVAEQILRRQYSEAGTLGKSLKLRTNQ